MLLLLLLLSYLTCSFTSPQLNSSSSSSSHARSYHFNQRARLEFFVQIVLKERKHKTEDHLLREVTHSHTRRERGREGGKFVVPIAVKRYKGTDGDDGVCCESHARGFFVQFCVAFGLDASFRSTKCVYHPPREYFNTNTNRGTLETKKKFFFQKQIQRKEKVSRDELF